MRRFFTLLISVTLLMGPVLAQEDEELTLFAVNVGKADALLLSLGNATYLIDTGTSQSWGALSKALTVLGVTELTGVILTHTDKDHVGGAEALAMSPMKIGGWYAPKYSVDAGKKHPLTKAAALRGDTVVWLEKGDTLPLGSGKLTVLGPLRESEEENDNSLVLLAEGGGGKMLLAGDMEYPEEHDLLDAGVIPECEVLKVPNHGDNDACSMELVRAVRPKVAVISTSTAEKPETPDRRVIQSLQAVGAVIAQTQNAEAGILVTLSGGQAQAHAMAYNPLPEMPRGIRLADKSGKDDTIRVINEGKEAVDLSGWFLRSERGGELFVFPAGTVLNGGESVLIVTESSEVPGDLVWPDKKVWHKSKEDQAVLYDVYGREIASLD